MWEDCKKQSPFPLPRLPRHDAAAAAACPQWTLHPAETPRLAVRRGEGSSPFLVVGTGTAPQPQRRRIHTRGMTGWRAVVLGRRGMSPPSKPLACQLLRPIPFGSQSPPMLPPLHPPTLLPPPLCPPLLCPPPLDPPTSPPLLPTTVITTAIQALIVWQLKSLRGQQGTRARLPLFACLVMSGTLLATSSTRSVRRSIPIRRQQKP